MTPDILDPFGPNLFEPNEDLLEMPATPPAGVVSGFSESQRSVVGADSSVVSGSGSSHSSVPGSDSSVIPGYAGSLSVLPGDSSISAGVSEGRGVLSSDSSIVQGVLDSRVVVTGPDVLVSGGLAEVPASPSPDGSVVRGLQGSAGSGGSDPSVQAGRADGYGVSLPDGSIVTGNRDHSLSVVDGSVVSGFSEGIPFQSADGLVVTGLVESANIGFPDRLVFAGRAEGIPNQSADSLVTVGAVLASDRGVTGGSDSSVVSGMADRQVIRSDSLVTRGLAEGNSNPAADPLVIRGSVMVPGDLSERYDPSVLSGAGKEETKQPGFPDDKFVPAGVPIYKPSNPVSKIQEFFEGAAKFVWNGTPLFVTGDPVREWDFAIELNSSVRLLSLSGARKDLGSVKATFFSGLYSQYIAALCEKMPPASEKVDVEQIPVGNIQYPILKARQLSNLSGVFLEDELRSVYRYFYKWQSLPFYSNEVRSIANSASVLSLYNTPLLAVAMNISVIGYKRFPIPYIAGPWGVVNSLPVELELAYDKYPFCFPVSIDREGYNKAGSSISKVSVSFIRIPFINGMTHIVMGDKYGDAKSYL